jgi:predicted component of type VI protein secretion system
MSDLADAKTPELQRRYKALHDSILEMREELRAIKAELEQRAKVEKTRAAVAAMSPADRALYQRELEAKREEREAGDA